MSIRNDYPFQFVKVKDVLDIPDVWTPVATLNLPYINGGVYMIGTSATWTYDVVAFSAVARWRINGSPWNVRTQEPKDATDIYTDYYAYPDYYDSGPLVIEIEMMKENVVGTLNVLFLDIFAQRMS